MIGLNKIGLNQVQLNQLYLNTLCACQKSSGGDGFPRLPGDVTRWSFKGLTNEQMSKNPRLEDADHKGRFLTFNNFAWSGMSGCNGYDYDFTKKSIFNYSGANVNAKIASDTFYIEKVDNARVNISIRLAQFKCRLKITGVSDSINSGEIQLLMMYSNKDLDNRIVIKTDGIYDVDIPNQEDGLIFIFAVSPQGTIENPLTLTTPITIEQLPLYPDALVFDGVDDYGICENFPILTKEKGYTVVALRKWLTPENKTNNEVLVANLKEPRWVAENWGAFGCEIKYNNTNPKTIRTMSFGNTPVINVNENNVLLCQTSNNYNGVDIVSGNNTSGPYLLICSGGTSFFAKAAIWELIILDHDATEEELTKIKNYFVKTYPWLFFDQAWTVTGKTNEDTDRATITNITGNGNNLVLSNFGFAGNSGYGEYAQNFNDYSFSNLKKITYTRTAASMKLDVPAGSSENIYSNVNDEAPIGFVYNFNLKITGLKTGILLSISQGATLDNIIADINQDGVYNIKATVDDSWNQRRIYFWIRNSNGPEMTLSIEQIPDHEGYLVTDGVDDKIESAKFNVNKDFAVVGKWELLDSVSIQSGIAKPNSFYLYSRTNGLGFYCKNASLGKFLNLKSIAAFNSKGIAYDHKWEEYTNDYLGSDNGYYSTLFMGFGNNSFSKIALKNLAIYPKALSKEDMIKAYIYLQTLKAK